MKLLQDIHGPFSVFVQLRSMLAVSTLLVSVLTVAMLIVFLLVVSSWFVAMLIVPILVVSTLLVSGLLIAVPSTVVVLAALEPMIAVGILVSMRARLNSIGRDMVLWKGGTLCSRISVLVSPRVMVISAWETRAISSRRFFSRTSLVIVLVRAIHLPMSSVWLVVTRGISGVWDALLSFWATHSARKAACHIHTLISSFQRDLRRSMRTVRLLISSIFRMALPGNCVRDLVHHP